MLYKLKSAYKAQSNMMISQTLNSEKALEMTFFSI